jgi:hypothetical protein
VSNLWKSALEVVNDPDVDKPRLCARLVQANLQGLNADRPCSLRRLPSRHTLPFTRAVLWPQHPSVLGPQPIGHRPLPASTARLWGQSNQCTSMRHWLIGFGAAAMSCAFCMLHAEDCVLRVNVLRCIACRHAARCAMYGAQSSLYPARDIAACRALHAARCMQRGSLHSIQNFALHLTIGFGTSLFCCARSMPRFCSSAMIVLFSSVNSSVRTPTIRLAHHTAPLWREPRPGADVAGVSPVPGQMWQGRA